MTRSILALFALSLMQTAAAQQTLVLATATPGGGFPVFGHASDAQAGPNGPNGMSPPQPPTLAPARVAGMLPTAGHTTRSSRVTR